MLTVGATRMDLIGSLVDLDRRGANLFGLIQCLLNQIEMPFNRAAFPAGATRWHYIILTEPAMMALVAFVHWYIVPNHWYIVPLFFRPDPPHHYL